MTIAASFEPEPSLDLRLFDGTADLMCVRDMQGRFVRVNKAWESTLGISTDEIANAPLLPLVHPADVPATLERMAQADRRHEIVNFVNRYRRRDGRYRHMEWRAQRFGDVILGRARDVTDLRGHAEALRTARRAPEETLADIGDRIRAPSDEILEMVQALDRTRLTDDQRVIVRALGQSLQTLEGLVAQLVEREREVAWATFRPTVEQPRLLSDRRVELRSSPRERPETSPSAPVTPTTATQSWVLETLRHVDENGAFHRTFRDLPSQTLGLLSVRLGYLGRFYPRRLQGLSAASGLMSAGRAAALLARMQDIGFVDVAGEFQAGQIRPYRVQAAMMRAFVEQLVVNLKSLAVSDYRAILALEAIETDEARAAPILAGLAAAVLNDMRLGRGGLGGRLNGVPLMAKGQPIALAIGADAIRKHGAAGEGWIEIALTSYARRFEVSRVHVRRVIANLEACGLVRDPASPSRLLVTGVFREEVGKYRAAVCHLLAVVLNRLV